MNKPELVSKIAEKAGISQKVAGEALTATFEVIKEQMAAGDEIMIVGFGTFSTRVREAHEGRNPQTGEALQIPEMTMPVFKSSRALKDAVRQ